MCACKPSGGVVGLMAIALLAVRDTRHTMIPGNRSCIRGVRLSYV